MGAVGTLDGLKLPVQVSSDSRIENAMYNGWLHSHFISNVLAFAPTGMVPQLAYANSTLRSYTGEIIHAALNAPGSWHDSRVARPLYELLSEKLPAEYYLVSDTAFPQGAGRCPGKIRAPLSAGSVLPDDPDELAYVLAFNRELLSFRQSAEWGMRSLQGAFSRLRVPLPIEDLPFRQDLLEICVRLHNIRVRCVGINEIRNVYQPIWAPVEEAWLWAEFERLTFGEIRTRDQVSRFHFGVEVR